MITAPFVSVIVPVFNDELRLVSCLDALDNQTYPKNNYEMIVVDNASTTDLKSIINRFHQSRYCYEANPGSYAARNTGIGKSKGEIIAFTDSDCIPSTHWIESGVNSLQESKGRALVGGAINLFYKNPDCLTGIELYESLEGFPQKKYIEEDNFGATANLFTYKLIFDSVGEFNPNLKSGGDAEWGKRVAKAGYILHYANDVEVSHPTRSTYTEYYSKTVRVMKGLPEFKAQNIPFIKIISELLHGLFIPPISRFRKVLKKAKKQTFKEKLKLLW